MRKGLLLIDIQNDYFVGGKCELVKSEKALENALIVLNIFRAAQLPVIHVQHINIREKATFFLPNTNGVKIHKALSPKPDEDIIIKHSPNSFFETKLEQVVREKNITELIICGMMTHMCIDTTVRAAKDYKIPVTLIKDACATKDLSFDETIVSADEVNHVYFASLNNMFAEIVKAKEFSLD